MVMDCVSSASRIYVSVSSSITSLGNSIFLLVFRGYFQKKMEGSDHEAVQCPCGYYSGSDTSSTPKKISPRRKKPRKKQKTNSTQHVLYLIMGIGIGYVLGKTF